ncbi:glutamate racemase [Chloroflexota bacterium]
MIKPAFRSIGVFDSGVGGFTVLREINRILPNKKLIYLADQVHVPYGERTLEEVRMYSKGIVQFLIDQGSALIVVACNTASAAALHFLRLEFPDTPIVGMEPAVKPAAEKSRSHKVGVLATPATFQGELYSSLVERFAKDVKLLQHTCPGLVRQIEIGELNSQVTRNILESAIQPMLIDGIDTIVLGCTHYPLVMGLINDITGGHIKVIDPAPAIARRVKNLMETRYIKVSESETDQITFFTTGDLDKFKWAVGFFLGIEGKPHNLIWDHENRNLKFNG